MDKSNHSMPTELKKRKSSDTIEIDRKTYDKMLSQYQEAMSLLEEMNEIIESQSAIIKKYEKIVEQYEGESSTDSKGYMDGFNDSMDFEEGVFKAGYTPGKGFEVAKPKSKAKFEGAHAELDPFNGRFGVNFRFGRDE